MIHDISELAQIEALMRLPQNNIALVIGDSDSGKTTLVSSLAISLAGSKTAVIDSDLGQSRLGPPTTVAWGLAPKGEFSWEAVRDIEFHFVGSTSAVGNLLPTLVAVKKMTEQAQKKAKKIIIDTSGLVKGPGVSLKQQKIDLVDPNVVIALQHDSELEPILSAYEGRETPVVLRMPVPAVIKRKSVPARTVWREKQFRLYFKNATKQKIFWSKLGIRNAPPDLETIAKNLRWRLLCLEDKAGKHLSLGLVTDINVSKRFLIILTPLTGTGQLGGIIFSRLHIDPSGKQLG